MRGLRLLVLLGIFSCGGSKTVGLPCTDSSVCDSGEDCLTFSGEQADGSCGVTLTACSIPCQTNQDCDSLAGGLMCFQGCEQSTSFCAKASN